MIAEPTTWIGLIGVLLVVAGPIITTIISAKRSSTRSDKRANKIGKQVAAGADDIREQVTSVQDQVVNSHGMLSNNLRDDVDRVIKTGDQTHELLLDTHKMLADHNTHILRLGDKVDEHGEKINKLSNDVVDLHGKVDQVIQTPDKNKDSDK